jgi:hypothetical protein
MILSAINACWHPAGVRSTRDRFRGYRFAQPPGYLLSSVRDEKPCFNVKMV